ncbi:hypothetical protein BHM03_00062409, partial [Ensete ventricosum]
DRLVIDGVEGLYAARRAMALVLRASWLSLWLIPVRRWQPRDLSQKATTMVEEEEGSSYVGCGYAATSWLRVGWLLQGRGCNRRKTGHQCARLLQRRIAAIRSERPLLVMFNSLLAVIKTVDSEILLRLRCRQIVAKDRCW